MIEPGAGTREGAGFAAPATGGAAVGSSRLSRVRAAALGRVDSYALLLAALSVLALGPLLQSGYFWGAHDARHSVYFLFEFDRVFQDGIWYPRWMPDMTYGYGYPLFNIYGPLAFYLGELFHLLGADFVTAVKLVFALAWICSGLAMYRFVRRLFGSRPAAFISGLAFVFIPYHIVDVYVRAALAESLALVFLPLTLWAFYESIAAPRVRSILFAAFSYAGLVLAHNGIALLFSPLLGLWIIFLVLRSSRAAFSRGLSVGGAAVVRAGLAPLAGLLLGLGLTGIFLLPLALEYRYINVAQWTANYYDYAEHFVEWFQLFSPSWGFGISQPGPNDGLSFQLGLVPFGLACAALAAALRDDGSVRPYVLFFGGVTLAVLALMFQFSLPLWQLFSLASVAQFPWRLLTLTMVSLSVLSGVILVGADTEEPDSLSLAALLLGALIVLGSYPYLTAQNMPQANEGPVSLKGLMRFESSANEMTGSTRDAQEQPPWSPLADNIMADKNIKSKIDYGAKPESLFIGLTKEGLHTNSELVGYNALEDNTAVSFYVQYYPGWTAYLLNKNREVLRQLPIEVEQPYGRIKVTLPRGQYWLLLRFEDTPPRIVGAVLSGVSLLAAILLLAWDWRVGRRRREGAPVSRQDAASP